MHLVCWGSIQALPLNNFVALGKSFHHFVDSFFRCKIKILSVQHCGDIYLPMPVSPSNPNTPQEQRHLLIYQSKSCSQILSGHRPSLGRDGMHKACAGLSEQSFSQNRFGCVFLDPWGVAQPGQPGQRGEVGTAKQHELPNAREKWGPQKEHRAKARISIFCLRFVTNSLHFLGQVTQHSHWSTLKLPLWNSMFPSRKWESLDQNFLTLTVYLLLCRAYGTFWKKHLKKNQPYLVWLTR